MTSITFDTLKYSQRLEKAGVPREQAEAFAEAQRESMGDAELATKADLREIKAEINGKITLLQWMLGLSLALSTGMIALLIRIAFSLPALG